MPTDIILNDNLDLAIKNGDFCIEESTYQHQAILLLMEKGEFKEYPTSGVASKRYLENEKPEEYARAIRLEFYADGMKVNTIKIEDDLQLTVDAIYQ